MSWGFTQKLPYVIVEPGPAYNVLGDNEGVAIIELAGVPQYESPGSLDLLTISVWGSPGETPTFVELIEPFFSNDKSIAPLEEYFPIDLTTDEALDLDFKDFLESQDAAIAAAKLNLSPEIAKALEAKVDLGGVGGPSGGLMFTLGIIDKATPGSLTGGKKIAGTGTISSTGAVGPIGGIEYKMISANRAGDPYFLAPAENCSEVLGHIPAGLKVFAVSNVQDALEVLKVIALDADVSKLPVCSAQ